jgi:hypothetical protein
VFEMKRFATASIVLGMFVLLSTRSSLGSTIVYYGSLNSFSTTTDSNVDLDPTTKVYAVNVGSSSSVTVNNGKGDVTFSGEWPSGVTLDSMANGGVETGATPTLTGIGADALKTVLLDDRISYSSQYGNYTDVPTTIHMNVVAGKMYDLQLFMAECWYTTAGSRGGDLSFTNGSNTLQLVDEYALNARTENALVYHYQFTAGSDAVTLIAGRASSLGDNSGALNALTLSTVPEPSSIALLVGGMIGLLAYAWRQRK